MTVSVKTVLRLSYDLLWIGAPALHTFWYWLATRKLS